MTTLVPDFVFAGLAEDTNRLRELSKSEKGKTAEQGNPDIDGWYDWREDLNYRMGHLAALIEVATTMGFKGIEEVSAAKGAIAEADGILDCGQEDNEAISSETVSPEASIN